MSDPLRTRSVYKCGGCLETFQTLRSLRHHRSHKTRRDTACAIPGFQHTILCSWQPHGAGTLGTLQNVDVRPEYTGGQADDRLLPIVEEETVQEDNASVQDHNAVPDSNVLIHHDSSDSRVANFADSVVLPGFKVNSAGRVPRKERRKGCRFSREESEIWSTFCDSTMSRKEGDQLLGWAGNKEYRGENVAYRTMWAMSNAICAEYVRGGEMSADFTEVGDGPQSLVFYYRSLYQVVKDLLSNPRFAGRQYTQFEVATNGLGKRSYGEFNTGEIYQAAQIKAGPNASPVPIFLSADKTYVLKDITVHPIIGMLFILISQKLSLFDIIYP